eukprot:UN03335
MSKAHVEAMFLFAGEIKSVRIPKPSIRGPIAFVEFMMQKTRCLRCVLTGGPSSNR